MAQARRAGVVLSDTLEIEPYPGDRLWMHGDISCRGGIVIRVSKHLQVLGGDGGDAMVETVRYNYNAAVRGHGTFLRHDNIHTHRGHRDAHHRHVGDWRTSEESRPEWVGEAGWPTLGQFIEMVDEWYWLNHHELPEP